MWGLQSITEVRYKILNFQATVIELYETVLLYDTWSRVNFSYPQHDLKDARLSLNEVVFRLGFLALKLTFSLIFLLQ